MSPDDRGGHAGEFTGSSLASTTGTVVRPLETTTSNPLALTESFLFASACLAPLREIAFGWQVHCPERGHAHAPAQGEQ